MSEIFLKNWKFYLSDKFGEIPRNVKVSKKLPAVVPGCVHLDLLHNKIIEDPFSKDNELKIEWVHFQEWTYETEFQKPEDLNSSLYLVCEGIDTVAQILLNGENIAEPANSFMEHNIEIPRAKIKNKNLLQIIFKSAKLVGKELEERHGKLAVELEPERVYLRKAQYSFGWDWGPSFPTSGIWKNIYLKTKPKISIENVNVITEKIEKESADVNISMDINGELDKAKKIEVSLEREDTEKYTVDSEEFSESKEFKVKITNPKLWFPNGLGEPNLYNLNIKIYDHEGNILTAYRSNAGLRKIELIQKDKDRKNVFRFQINGKPIFAKGYNWIPADSFLPRVDDDKYRRLLSYAKESNCNMIRVWGGGIYEKEIFYNLCDEFGLLVWQDFMFACASYPTHKEFLENVSEEVRQNVKRLRIHPSVAVWCGNNENEWIWYQKQSDPIKKMPGYKIYHELIPKLLNELDQSRPYWPSSPFGSDEDPNSFESGNTHQWNIWSFWKDYDEVIEDYSKFVTEFGFQAPANIDTFRMSIPESNLKIQDKIFEFHNKQIDGPARLIRFLSSHLPIETKMDDYIYLTQLNQGFALKKCIEHWRTNGITNGSIIWQLNDCWPVSSWATIDSESQPKIAYYFVKNAFKQFLLSFKENDGNVFAVINNSNQNSIKGKLKSSLIKVSKGKIVDEINTEIEIEACSTYLHKLEEEIFNDKFPGDNALISRFYNENNELESQSFHIGNPWKYYRMNKPKVKIDYGSIKKNKIVLKAKSTVWFIDLYHPGIVFEDRGFIMLKGETKEINFIKSGRTKFKKRLLQIYSLNNYLSD